MNTLFWKNQTETSRKKLEDLAGEIADMDYTKFTEGEDYASLEKRYSQQGQKAMDDTIGKVAARTGGLASSYATAAGNQAYSGYMEKLEDAARGLYDSQRQEKIDNFNIRNSLYGQYYNAQRDSEANDQWQQQFERDGDQITYERTQKTIEGEEKELERALSYNPDAYPTYADYQAAFPGTLIPEARFNQIKGIATGMYAEEHNEPVTLSEEDTGELTDREKAILDEYNKTIDRGETPSRELSDLRDEILGLYSNKVARLVEKALAATTEEELSTYIMEIDQYDSEEAERVYDEWLKKHPQAFTSWSGEMTNAGFQYDEKIFSY